VIQLRTCIEPIGRAKAERLLPSFLFVRSSIDNPEGANHSGKTQKGRRRRRSYKKNRLLFLSVSAARFGDVRGGGAIQHLSSRTQTGGGSLRYHRIRVDAPEVAGGGGCITEDADADEGAPD
jgi:hypothetical protein